LLFRIRAAECLAKKIATQTPNNPTNNPTERTTA
jgi:hypothetical protein